MRVGSDHGSHEKHSADVNAPLTALRSAHIQSEIILPVYAVQAPHDGKVSIGAEATFSARSYVQTVYDVSDYARDEAPCGKSTPRLRCR